MRLSPGRYRGLVNHQGDAQMHRLPRVRETGQAGIASFTSALAKVVLFTPCDPEPASKSFCGKPLDNLRRVIPVKAALNVLDRTYTA
jgi:hypothetical protein